MKKILSILTIVAMAMAANFVVSIDNADAVPAFARQMQMTCKNCHFQHFPKLNAMGRAFKANGYTDVAVDTIDGDWGTSIPINLNASWVTKMRYVKTVDANAVTQTTGDDRGSYQAVDEGTFFIGGRVSEHIGAAIEVADGAPWGNGTIVFGHDLESLHTHLGFALWSTDGAGVFWGKELFNTGLIRGSRGWENRDLTQAAGIVYRFGSWSGMTAYATHDWFFTQISLVTRGQHGVDIGADFSWAYRFALTPPTMAGFDTMIGVYGQFGGHSYGGDTGGNGSRTDETTSLHGVDFQAQGNLTEGITLELLGNIIYDTGNPSARNLWNRGSGQDYIRAQVGFDLGLLDDRLIAKFNYLYTSARAAGSTVASGSTLWDRKSADIVSLGLYWNIRENVSLRPEISWVVGGDSDALVGNNGANVGMTRSGISNDTEFILMLWYSF